MTKLKPLLAPRQGEIIGGGWILARRAADERIVFSKVPYEHGTQEDATAQAERLSALNPGLTYLVLRVVAERASENG